jgi:acyl carrier protein
MTERQILEGVQEVIREHLQGSAPVDEDTDLFRDLELDSLKQLTLVVELENHFRICFDAGEEQGLQTIGDVVRLIAHRLPGRDKTPEIADA